MKKAWKCSLCTQICSRRENLKRHSERLHNGEGKPLLRYISGNSILTPEESPHFPFSVLFQDEYGIKPTIKAPNLKSYTQNQSSYDWQDKLFEPFLKAIRFQSIINSWNQSRYQNQSPYSPYQYAAFHNSVGSGGPVYFRTETASNQLDNIPRNYDGVSGFKVDICLNCLTTLQTSIGSKDINLQEIHKCTPGTEDAIKRLGPEEYALDLQRKLNENHELLFKECKNWANNTSGQIYLVARKIQASHENETEGETTLVHYDAFPFLSKVLAQSKTILTDNELYEFLKLAKNQTKTVITLTGKPGEGNSSTC